MKRRAVPRPAEETPLKNPKLATLLLAKSYADKGDPDGPLLYSGQRYLPNVTQLQ